MKSDTLYKIVNLPEFLAIDFCLQLQKLTAICDSKVIPGIFYLISLFIMNLKSKVRRYLGWQYSEMQNITVECNMRATDKTVIWHCQLLRNLIKSSWRSVIKFSSALLYLLYKIECFDTINITAIIMPSGTSQSRT